MLDQVPAHLEQFAHGTVAGQARDGLVAVAAAM